MNATYWSLVIDETTDVSVESKMAPEVQYWCPKRFKLIVITTLDLPLCADTTATCIFNSSPIHPQPVLLVYTSQHFDSVTVECNALEPRF